MAPTVDLVILDHIHYVDLDAKDVNGALKAVIMKLGDLARETGVPIVIVAHLKKNQLGKGKPLTPSLEDFHGSAELGRVAKTCIILAPCRELNVKECGSIPPGYATYFSIVKSRKRGSRLPVGVLWYDPRRGNYRDPYAIGRFIAEDRHWEPVARELNDAYVNARDFLDSTNTTPNGKR